VDATNHVNLSVTKHIPIREEVRLQFRADAFNLDSRKSRPRDGRFFQDRGESRRLP
jgi:hypothetical protein